MSQDLSTIINSEPVSALVDNKAVQSITQQEPVQIALNTINEMVNGFFAQLPFLIVGLIILLIFYGLGKVVKKIIKTTGERTRLDNALVKILASTGSGVTIILGVLIAAVVILPDFNPSKLLTGLGISSVAIGFAFKDIFENFLAGILILWRQPFKINDQIITGDYEGTVVGIDIRATQLKTYNGEKVIIPNGEIFKNPVQVNTAYSKRRVQFDFGISYNASIEEARKIALQVLNNADEVMSTPEPWVHVTEHGGSSINFKAYFWTKSEQADVLRVKDQIATQLKIALDNAGIEIPFPQQVMYLRQEEGNEEDVLSQVLHLANQSAGEKLKQLKAKK